MGKTLYCLHHPDTGTTFGVKPYSEKLWAEYQNLSFPITLSGDLKWTEPNQLQHLLEKADIWDDFPAVGLTLVGAQCPPGDEDQTLDLLYLREDGALLPCELKINGPAKDSHGQLVRYIADLQFQSPNLKWLEDYHGTFLERISDSVARDRQQKKFEDFIARFIKRKDIDDPDKFIRVLPRSGILIHEGFPLQLLKAVRHLNDQCGFSFRMIEIKAFTAHGWNADQREFKMRLDFVDRQ